MIFASLIAASALFVADCPNGACPVQKRVTVTVSKPVVQLATKHVSVEVTRARPVAKVLSKTADVAEGVAGRGRAALARVVNFIRR